MKPPIQNKRLLAVAIVLLGVAFVIVWKSSNTNQEHFQTESLTKTTKPSKKSNRPSSSRDHQTHLTPDEIAEASNFSKTLAPVPASPTPSPEDSILFTKYGANPTSQTAPPSIAHSNSVTDSTRPLYTIITRFAHSTSSTSSENSQASRAQIQSLVTTIESYRSSNSLSHEDRQSLIQYLSADPPATITPGQHHWIVDELITTLRADGADNAALSQDLASLYRDRTRHMIVRDYVLQHLGHLTHEGGDLEIIRQTLQSATTEKQGTIAGTALLALNQTGTSETTSAQALQIASDPQTDLRSRITALQIAGQQGNVEAIPIATETAADSSQPTAFRLAAIASLAELGATGQQALIQQLTASTDLRIKTAATAALTKLQTSN